MNVAIMTDSNSGITSKEAEKLGIFMLAMPFYVDEKLCYEGVDLTHKDFYTMLKNGCNVYTSQPAPADVTRMWDKILESYDSIVYIPMSSGLSNSCNTALIMSQGDNYEGKVFVADATRISVTQRQACIDALNLAKSGQPAGYIRDYLEKTGKDASIYIAIDTMEYLKKGGRITPAAAGIASVLGIKPILQIQGDKLDKFAKARGMVAAKKAMLKAIKNDLHCRFQSLVNERKIALGIAYAGDNADVASLESEMKKEFKGIKIIKDRLSLSIACHTGEGAVGIACFRADS